MRVRVLLLLFLLAVVRPVDAQSTGATVSGVVHDSIAHAALGGAIVQLVSADSVSAFGQSSVSDATGLFSFRNVPKGRYRIGFFHPVLDSLGLEPTLRLVTVQGAEPVRADLAVPSALRVRSAICGAPSERNAGTVVMGSVYGATDRATLPGVTVVGSWLEYTFGATGRSTRMPRVITTTRENGWFALCNVPAPGTITLMATRGADSTDVIELQVSAEGLVRRELYLGTSRVVSGAPRGDLRGAARVQHVGNGRLTGTVASSMSARVLAGAQVSMPNGPSTRANERGEWTLTDVPSGTRTIDIRAVGHYPERRSIDVIEGAPAIHVTLSTLNSVLDTMKTRASRFVGLSGFQSRSKSGLGRFLTAENIISRSPTVTSEIFRAIPGLYLEYITEADLNSAFSGAAVETVAGSGTLLDRMVVMRGTFSDRCLPSIFMNGQYLSDRLSVPDFDSLIRPSEIAGIEIYSPTNVPGLFQRAQTGCGAIVFWTK